MLLVAIADQYMSGLTLDCVVKVTYQTGKSIAIVFWSDLDADMYSVYSDAFGKYNHGSTWFRCRVIRDDSATPYIAIPMTTMRRASWDDYSTIQVWTDDIIKAVQKSVSLRREGEMDAASSYANTNAVK